MYSGKSSELCNINRIQSIQKQYIIYNSILDQTVMVLLVFLRITMDIYHVMLLIN